MTYDPQKAFAKIDLLLTNHPDMSLPQVAEQLGMERHIIERIIHKITGMQFRKYRQNKRILKGVELLGRDVSNSEKQVAFEVGYRSLQAFARAVKALTGKTPMQAKHRDGD